MSEPTPRVRLTHRNDGFPLFIFDDDSGPLTPLVDVYELHPVGRSLADDPAAVERAAECLFEKFKHLLEIIVDWDDPTMRVHQQFWRNDAERVLRTAETGDADGQTDS